MANPEGIGAGRPDPLLSTFRRDLLARGRGLSTNDPIVQERFKNRAAILEARRREEYLKIHPPNPAFEVLPDGLWKGERAFLIGGGPSLKGFDFERLRGRGRIIAINRAFEFLPFADVLFFMDRRFYQMVHGGKLASKLDLWNSFAGLKVMLNIGGADYPDVRSVRSLGRVGLSPSIAKGLYHGNNSGVGAINLAYALGASPVYLLGYDLKFSGAETHFHSGYGFNISESIVRSFIVDLERQRRFVIRTGMKVINLNPASGLRSYPFSTIEEVLNGKGGKSLGDNDGVLQEPVPVVSSSSN